MENRKQFQGFYKEPSPNKSRVLQTPPWLEEFPSGTSGPLFGKWSPRPFPSPPPSPVFSPKACACRQGQARHCPLTDRDPHHRWRVSPGARTWAVLLCAQADQFHFRGQDGEQMSWFALDWGGSWGTNLETPQANWSYPNMKPGQKRRPHGPGGSVVETLCFHCRVHGFEPWPGNWDPACGVAKESKKKKKRCPSPASIHLCPSHVLDLPIGLQHTHWCHFFTEWFLQSLVVFFFFLRWNNF